VGGGIALVDGSTSSQNYGFSTGATDYYAMWIKNCSIYGSSNVGGAIGTNTVTSVYRYGTIVQNCDIRGYAYVGGILGGSVSVYNNARNGYVESTYISELDDAARKKYGITLVEASDRAYFGGIFGYAAYSDTDMIYNSLINAPNANYVGAIGGRASALAAANAYGFVSKDCVVVGKNYVGGLFGTVKPIFQEASINNSTARITEDKRPIIRDSYSNAFVYGNNYVAGIAGAYESVSGTKVINSVSTTVYIPAPKLQNLYFTGTVNASGANSKASAVLGYINLNSNCCSDSIYAGVLNKIVSAPSNIRTANSDITAISGIYSAISGVSYNALSVSDVSLLDATRLIHSWDGKTESETETDAGLLLAERNALNQNIFDINENLSNKQHTNGSYVNILSYTPVFVDNDSDDVKKEKTAAALDKFKAEMLEAVRGSFYNKYESSYIESVDLPDGYEQVVYLESTGAQYIDTGVIPTTFDYEIETKCNFSVLTGGPNCVWGFMGSSAVPRWLCGSWENGYLMNANTTSQITSADNNTHIFINKVYNNGTNNVWESYIDGVAKQTSNVILSQDAWTNNKLSIYVFAINYASTTEGFFPSGSKLYYLKIKKADTLVRNFVPVKVTDTGEYGLFDLVEERFYANAGAGSFKGPGSAGGTESRTLPSGFKQIEYLEGNGIPYINTGIIPSASLRTDITLSYNKFNSENIVLGAMTASTYAAGSNYCLDYYSSNKKTALAFGKGNKVFGKSTLSTNIKYRFTINPDSDASLYLNGSLEVTSGNTKTFPAKPIYLFCYNNNGSKGTNTTYYFDGKIYSCKMTEGSKVVRDFVPAKKLSTGELGMYDFVSGDFFTNDGAGYFTCYDDLPEHVLPSGYTELQYVGTPASGKGYALNTGITKADYAQWRSRIESWGAQYYSWFGNYNDEASNSFRAINNTKNDGYALFYANDKAGGGGITVSSAYTAGQFAEYTLADTSANKLVTVNGVKYSGAHKRGTENYNPIYIFGTSENSATNKMDFSYLRLFSEGKLVGDYLAAKRNSDGAAGMYDFVSGDFLTNDKLLAGPSALTDEEIEEYKAMAPLQRTLGEIIFTSAKPEESASIFSVNTKQGVFLPGTAYYSKEQAKLKVLHQHMKALDISNPDLSNIREIYGIGPVGFGTLVGLESLWNKIHIYSNGIDSYAFEVQKSEGDVKGLLDTNFGTEDIPETIESLSYSLKVIDKKDSLITSDEASDVEVHKGDAAKEYKYNYLDTIELSLNITLVREIQGTQSTSNITLTKRFGPKDNSLANLGTALVNDFTLNGSLLMKEGTVYAIDAIHTSGGSLVLLKDGTVMDIADASVEPKLNYIVAEYVEDPTGADVYIDTGFVPNQDSGIEIKYWFTGSIGSAGAFPYGSRVTWGSRQFSMHTSDSSSRNYLAYGNASKLLDKDIRSTDILIKGNKNEWSINENKYTFTYSAFTTPGTMILFGHRNTKSTPDITSQPYRMKIYYCKIYDNGKLIRDYIPVMDKKTEEFGLFDLVNGEFYGNSGTGKLIGRIPVTLDDCQKLEYIDSSGTQCINTGCVGKNGTVIEAEIGKSTGLISGNNGILGTGYLGLRWEALNRIRGAYGNGNWQTAAALTQNDRNTIYLSNTDFKYNGTSYTIARGSTFDAENIYMFAYNNLGTIKYGKTRMYYAKIWQDGNLVREFIPVKIKETGEVGMWDLVERRFYENYGSGAFTGGPAVD